MPRTAYSSSKKDSSVTRAVTDMVLGSGGGVGKGVEASSCSLLPVPSYRWGPAPAQQHSTPPQHRRLQVAHRQGSARPSLPGPCASASLLPSGFHCHRHFPPHSAETQVNVTALPAQSLLVAFSPAIASLRTSADMVQHLFNQLPSLSGLGFVVYYFVLI